MKNNQLIRNVGVLLAVALLCAVAGSQFLAQQKDDVYYTGNPNITGVIKLSDYNPNLKGTVNDVDI